MSVWILGISGSHNGTCCLLEGNKIRIAIQEERLTGIKHARVYGGRHCLAMKYCLDAAGISASDLSMIVIANQASSLAEENDIWMNPDLRGAKGVPRKVVSHHLAHAASTYATSGFERAAILVVDGMGSLIEDLNSESMKVVVDPIVGYYEHLSLHQGFPSGIKPLEIHTCRDWLVKYQERMWDFFSLGGMYAAVAQQIFGDANDAGKVMGLAPYGHISIPIEEFVQFDENRLKFPNLVQAQFKQISRWPNEKEGYCNLAASVQNALEGALIRITKRLRKLTGESHLCLAGGVALNSVANQKICQEAGFDQVFIVPAADDSGIAIGAAYLGLWELDSFRSPGKILTDAHGHAFSALEIETAIQSVPDIHSSKPDDLLDVVADRLQQGQIGGWFQGGSEMGPRALGQRSILCSPALAEMKDKLNRKVKFRESFRPFAPTILAEHASKWFNFGKTAVESPFMLRVVPFKEEVKDLVPAVVHIDGTGRLQTLTAEVHGRYFELLNSFYKKTGVPVLLNTSMNIQGEPIAEQPSDALWCLLGTGLDFCVIGDWLIIKKDNFRTILDYVPAVIAESYTLRLDVSDNRLQTAIQHEDAVMVRTQTPWGVANIVLPIRFLPLLSRIDGQKDGHELQRLLPNNQVLQDLCLLRRMHLIKFIKDDSRDNHTC